MSIVRAIVPRHAGILLVVPWVEEAARELPPGREAQVGPGLWMGSVDAREARP